MDRPVHDYRMLASRPDLVVFETEPFTEPCDLIGALSADLAVAAELPDYDIWLQVFDVAPDGTAWNLSAPGSALLRAGLRDGGPARRLARPGETLRLRLDRMVTANRFLPGHRLRIVPSGAFTPLFSLNPQTGGEEFDTDQTRAGTIRVQHSRRSPSRLIIPIVPVPRD